MLAKILMMIFFPSSSLLLNAFKSERTPIKEGANEPISGNSPIVVVGVPPSVIFAIIILL